VASVAPDIEADDFVPDGVDQVKLPCCRPSSRGREAPLPEGDVYADAAPGRRRAAVIEQRIDPQQRAQGHQAGS